MADERVSIRRRPDAARDVEAVAQGEWLAVVGDMHPGANPLVQGLFAHRHPDPRAMLDLIRAALGRPFPILLPPFAVGMGQDGRGMPVTAEDDIHFAAMAGTRRSPHAEPGCRTSCSSMGQTSPIMTESSASR